MTRINVLQAPQEFSSQTPLRLRAVRGLLAALIRTLFKVRVVGTENIPTGNYIVLANHLSWIDPLLLMIALPAAPRLYFIGARQAFTKSWKIRLMQEFGSMIPFERGAHWVGKDVFAKPLQALEQGELLAFFPEGDAFADEGELHPLQRGIGHLLLRANYSVLPVALSGTRELYWHKPITITIGEPLHVATVGVNRRAVIDAAVTQVARALRAILPRYESPVVTRKPLHFLTNWLD